MDGSFQVEKGSGKGAQGLNQLYVSATFTDRIERQVQKIAGGGLKILKPDNYLKQAVREGVNQKRVMVSRNHPATPLPCRQRTGFPVCQRRRPAGRDRCTARKAQYGCFP